MPIGHLSTNIDSSKVTYSNELAFAIHHYTSQEQKLFDIVISQLHLFPLYDEEVCTGLMELDTELRDNICHINEVKHGREKSLQTLPQGI